MRTLSEKKWLERIKRYNKLDQDYIDYCEAKKEINEKPFTYKQWLQAEKDMASI